LWSAAHEWVLAAEGAADIGHALALEELAQAGPAEQDRAHAFFAAMQDLLWEARRMAARVE
jgi:hypothetical protein